MHSHATGCGRGLHQAQTNAPSCLASPASHGEASAAALFRPKGRGVKPVLAGRCCASSIVIKGIRAFDF
ncbi:MAG: hypothetical protein COW84_00930 [Gammaproteobacteria bacterium CG22_combo_CG10-13_8_21_14_all_40_8]|nr:MAG: hypothetical protein COW84_00930 [Gammaproteobacteria bacterium CG22_combo_CG10-13_8_21_14_all_40_8]